MNIEGLIDMSKEMTEQYILEKYFNFKDVEPPLFEIQAWEVEQYYDDDNQLERAVIFLSATIIDDKIYEFVYDTKVGKIFFKEFKYKEEDSIGINI